MTKEDIALQNMIRMLDKTKDKRLRHKARRSSSYNRSIVKTKASTATRNTRSRHNYTSKMKSRFCTAKISINLNKIDNQKLSLKKGGNRLPKLHPITTKSHSKKVYVPVPFIEKSELRMNQNWLKDQTEQYKYLAEGGVVNELSNMSKVP